MNQKLARTLVRSWLAFGALGVGCGKDDSLGNDRDDALPAVGSGGEESPTGGTTGGSSGGDSPGQGGADGTPGGEGGGGAVDGRGGTAPTTGGKAPTTGGRAPTTGGAAPVTGGASEPGAGSGGATEPGDWITDPSDVGTGPCADTPLADVLQQIAVLEPNLPVPELTSPETFVVRGGVVALHVGDGFRVVVSVGAGDCPAGCADREYWYFETDAECRPVRVGHYARLQSAGCVEVGEPLWGLPAPSAAGSCAPLDLSDLNTNCVDDACPSALEAVHFYGAAGMNGPEFCWCVITCDAAGSGGLCPESTRCQYIGDGPGEVCWGS